RHDQVASPGLLELANHVRSGLRRALPVDVAALIPGNVFAERVKCHVAVGEVSGGVALEVANEAGAGAGDGDGSRVHYELGDVGPDQFASHETDGVGPHGPDRPHRIDASPGGGHREL